MGAFAVSQPVSEAALQAAVIELAERCGWRVAHFADSRKQLRSGRLVGDRRAAGFPDLVLVRGARLLFVELKTEKGKLRPAQVEWLAALGEVEDDAAGRVVVCVWRPGDFDSGEIARVLTSPFCDGGWPLTSQPRREQPARKVTA